MIKTIFLFFSVMFIIVSTIMIVYNIRKLIKKDISKQDATLDLGIFSSFIIIAGLIIKSI